MTADVEFIVAGAENVLEIPRSALVEKEGREFVTVGAGAPRRQEIKTGISDGKMVEVLEGLKEGDRVLVTGASTSNASENESNSSGSRARRMPMMMGGPH
jgi:multidrug efflux pump subunit AcrA (membrane-fusion protein)